MELEYDTFGDRADPPLLLIIGLGIQMIAWPEQVCRDLASSGFYVIRFDNRDSGLSSKFDSFGVPDILKGMGGDCSSAAYTLSQMASDAVGLLDYLRLPAAHVVGVSMGGMIAQQAVLDWPDRFLSLCSMMSSTGSRLVGQPSAAAVAALLQPLGTSREEIIARSLESLRVLAGERYFNRERVFDLVSRSYDRCYCPDSSARQLMAVICSPDRTERLSSVRIPTLVVHGLADPFVDVSGGFATAEAIEGSRLLTFEDMGHDIPDAFWKEIQLAVIDNARRA